MQPRKKTTDNENDPKKTTAPQIPPTQEGEKKIKMPDIGIRTNGTNEEWEKAINILRKVRITKTRNVQGDMHVTVAPADNNSQATKDLTLSGMQFYCYVLGGNEEKRDLASGVNLEATKENLLQQGAKFTEVHAICSQRGTAILTSEVNDKRGHSHQHSQSSCKPT